MIKYRKNDKKSFCIWLLGIIFCAAQSKIICTEQDKLSGHIQKESLGQESPAQAQKSLAQEPESFVIKKKKKKVSKSKLQEQTCRVFGDQMSLMPEVHQKIAEIQKILLDETCKYLESSQEGIIVKNGKNNLHDLLQISKNFEQKLQEFCNDCDTYVRYLKDLCNKK